jgi:anti-sigma regulatory factor (Ser/Thr protein kinase)
MLQGLPTSRAGDDRLDAALIVEAARQVARTPGSGWRRPAARRRIAVRAGAHYRSVVDWYLDARDAQSTQQLRREIAAYLGRHADVAADLTAAELAVSELLGNLVRHAPGPAWVSLRWPADVLTLVVTDLGPGFRLPQLPVEVDPLAEGGRGLLIVDAVADRLEATARQSGAGARVTVRLPLPRPPATSYDPEPSSGTVLPELPEARPEGGFGKEAFLRALVVQLAQAVEKDAGPDLAERAVTQVGTDVGGQMEREYRHARDLVGRLTPEQIADCLVRLKTAIDGGFHVTEASPARIVLTNTRCPFGPVVQHAPALCRMTSSVFGGIAARNSEHGRAAVVLEERIAVGDPHCRVVVHLGEVPAAVAAHAHGYEGRGTVE